MGTDIHSRAEIKWSENSSWEIIEDAFWKYPYADRSRPVSLFNVYYSNRPFVDRSYALFSLLAGVRNYIYDVDVLVKPRGVPSDASPEWKNYVNDWGPDLHTTSWLKTEEITAIIEYSKNFVTDEGYTMYNLAGNYLEDAIAPFSSLEGKNQPKIRYLFGFDN